jgi:uncharacterized membrane protein HdeD (DUF308 family)
MLAIAGLARYWWVVALRGLAGIAFGLLALIWPGATLAVLILLYGAYALADGVLSIGTGIRGDAEHRLAMLLNGVLGIAAGIVTFVWPGLTALALLYIIAAWAILTGVLQVFAAVRLRRVIPNEWSLILAGALSVVFGIVLIAAPGAGALALILLIGAYALVFGVMLLILSWRLRAHRQALPVGASGGVRAGI